MKKIFYFLGLFLFLQSCSEQPKMATHDVNIDSLLQIGVYAPKPMYYKKSTEHTSMKFYEKLGFRESRCNYNVVNHAGYLGKYQFHINTLKGLGISVSKKEFLMDTLLQEKAVRLYVSFNKKVLKEYISNYDGSDYIIENDTFLITTSGLCAAAHLGGAGNVIKLFTENKVFKDGNGVPITSYIKEFANYDI